jgi:hypothetical protein
MYCTGRVILNFQSSQVHLCRLYSIHIILIQLIECLSINKHCCPDVLEYMNNVYSTTALQYMYSTLALMAFLKSVISQPVDWMTY